jgi:dolichol-phosphate mannosyltransferase
MDSINNSVSIIVPTYQERENLPELIRQVAELKKQIELLELVIVDDNSDDGTEEYINSLQSNWIKLIVRKNTRGLSTAVIMGFQQASYEVLVCMDADLSHPVSAIPEMLKKIQLANTDLVIASRFMLGASIDTAWPLWRKMTAAVAKWLAKPFTAITDPMSGFFCLRKTTFLRCTQLDPVGYKIALELMVKCPCKNIIEIPIHFSERQYGKSKLNGKEYGNYLKHLWKLLNFKLNSERSAH